MNKQKNEVIFITEIIHGGSLKKYYLDTKYKTSEKDPKTTNENSKTLV